MSTFHRLRGSGCTDCINRDTSNREISNFDLIIKTSKPITTKFVTVDYIEKLPHTPNLVQPKNRHFIFSEPTGQTARPILTNHGSNDAKK